ncbi:trehalose-phosphatase, partial [Colletotrichum cereale]
NKSGITNAFVTARRRVIMCDYDGTLVPFVNNPEDAVPSKQLLNDLRVLAKSSSNSVWLISGRDQKFLSTHFRDIPGLGLSAEHGAIVKNPGESWKTLVNLDDIAKWKPGAQNIMQKWANATQGTRVEPKEYSLSWHYREA